MILHRLALRRSPRRRADRDPRPRKLLERDSRLRAHPARGRAAGYRCAGLGRRLAEMPGVVEVHDLHVWTITSGFPALSAHVLVERGDDCHARRRELEDLLLQEYGIAHDAPGRSRRATRASVDSDASMSQSEEAERSPRSGADRVLNELRVVLPGVQVLFAFLLTVPFSNCSSQITNQQRQVYFATFLCTTAATALLIAPSASPPSLAGGQGAVGERQTGFRSPGWSS